MYNTLMKFLNNIRNRYSFNFLVVVGLINLITFICLFIAPSTTPPFFEVSNPGMGFVLVLFATIGYSVVSIFVAILLHIFLKSKITNERFLNSKLIFFLQIIGFLLVIAPIAVLLYFLRKVA